MTRIQGNDNRGHRAWACASLIATFRVQLARSIRKAAKDGMVIGMTSQCLYGRVNERVYRNRRLVTDAGGIYCEDMLPEVAYVKLGWLLGNYGKEERRRCSQRTWQAR